MTPLDHAEAHERLADLALEPGALDRLGPAATDALGAHVVTCETCRRDVEAWRRTHAASSRPADPARTASSWPARRRRADHRAAGAARRRAAARRTRSPVDRRESSRAGSSSRRRPSLRCRP
jgi:hypothetical protein